MEGTLMGHRHHLNDQAHLDNFSRLVQARQAQGKKTTVEILPAGTRTGAQNNAMWLWLSLIATELNNAGFEMHITSPVLKSEITAPWDKDSVKRYIWAPVQEAVAGVESSTEASKTDYGAIESVIGRYLGETFGISVPVWPSRLTQGE